MLVPPSFLRANVKDLPAGCSPGDGNHVQMGRRFVSQLVATAIPVGI